MQIFLDTVELFNVMIKMYEDKFEPLTGIEHTKTGMFNAFMRRRIVNECKDIVDPFPALDDEVASIFLIDLFGWILLRHHRRHLEPDRDGI